MTMPMTTKTRRLCTSLCASLCACVALAHLPACATRTATSGEQRAQRITRAHTLTAQGQRAFERKDFDEAINLFQQAVSVNPEFGAAWNNLGLALMRRGGQTDYLASQQAFQSAASLLPSDPTPYRNLGLLYQQQGFEEDALRNFENALDIDENDIESLRGATRSIMLLKRTDQMTLQRLRKAQLIETDKEWREIITRERIRVENEIEERTKR